MKTNRLLPEFRLKMRELIQGFIEHCEFSHTIVGRIERTVSVRGRTYGFPTFTFYGPPHPDLETRFLNLVGINESGDTATAETLLQLIERLVLQPQIATGRVLRILPVTDPVALELDAATSGSREIETLEEAVRRFLDHPSDGTIEIALTDREQLSLTVAGPAAVLHAVDSTAETLRRLRSEDSLEGLSVVSRERRTGVPWTLRLEVPRTWSVALAVHWTSQALVVFFRSQLDNLLREASPALAYAE